MLQLNVPSIPLIPACFIFKSSPLLLDLRVAVVLNEHPKKVSKDSNLNSPSIKTPCASISSWTYKFVIMTPFSTSGSSLMIIFSGCSKLLQ